MPPCFPRGLCRLWVLGRTFATGNTAGLMYLVCVWHELPLQLCRSDTVGVAGSLRVIQKVFHWSVPPLSHQCLAHSSSERALTRLSRKLCLFSGVHLRNLVIVHHWELWLLSTALWCSALHCAAIGSRSPMKLLRVKAPFPCFPFSHSDICVKWAWLHTCHHLRAVWVCFLCLPLSGRSPCGLFSWFQKHLRTCCLHESVFCNGDISRDLAKKADS